MSEEKIFIKRHRDKKDLAGEHKWGDRGQMILLLVFILAVLVDVFFLEISAGPRQAIPSWLKISLGTVFALAGAVLARAGLKIIFGKKRQEPIVVKEGVFSIVRHPIYLGSILAYLGFLFFTCSILGFAVWILIIFFYHYISRYEEKLLLQKFGDEYKKYINQIPMWIPLIKK